jgi:rhodanese-related sulfurtransferase
MKILSFILCLILANTIKSQNVNYTFQNVNAKTFNELIKKGDGILLDVRTIAEFNNYHIAEAQQLNYYDSDFKEKVLELPKNKPI